MNDELTDRERECYFDSAIIERERIRQILSCKEAESQPNLAHRLAFDWDGSVEDARKRMAVSAVAQLADVLAMLAVQGGQISRHPGLSQSSKAAPDSGDQALFHEPILY